MSRSQLTDPDALRTVLGERLQFSLLRPLARIAFWAAIVLPFLYLPLLVTGLDGGAETTAFVALLVCNTVAIYVGQYHSR